MTYFDLIIWLAERRKKRYPVDAWIKLHESAGATESASVNLAIDVKRTGRYYNDYGILGSSMGLEIPRLAGFRLHDY